jgi:hypothetical protein
MEASAKMPDSPRETQAVDGQRPLYVMARESDPIVGYLDHDGEGFLLVDGSVERRFRLGAAELASLRRVCGAIMPV